MGGAGEILDTRCSPRLRGTAPAPGGVDRGGVGGNVSYVGMGGTGGWTGETPVLRREGIKEFVGLLCASPKNAGGTDAEE